MTLTKKPPVQANNYIIDRSIVDMTGTDRSLNGVIDSTNGTITIQSSIIIGPTIPGANAYAVQLNFGVISIIGNVFVDCVGSFIISQGGSGFTSMAYISDNIFYATSKTRSIIDAGLAAGGSLIILLDNNIAFAQDGPFENYFTSTGGSAWRGPICVSLYERDPQFRSIVNKDFRSMDQRYNPLGSKNIYGDVPPIGLDVGQSSRSSSSGAIFGGI
jgi:hypothetical protein